MDAKSREDDRALSRGATQDEARPASAPGAPSEQGDRGKRRLGMMPEVLPAPTRGHGEGSPRQRTLNTMERMLTAAAASALITGCSNNKSGGDTGYGVVDPMPPPVRCPGVAASVDVKATWKEGQAGLIV